MKSFSHNLESLRATMNSLDEVKRTAFAESRRPTGEIVWKASIPRTRLVMEIRSGMLEDNTFTPAPDLGLRIIVTDLQTLTPAGPTIRVKRTPYALLHLREKIGELWKNSFSKAG